MLRKAIEVVTSPLEGGAFLHENVSCSKFFVRETETMRGTRHPLLESDGDLGLFSFDGHVGQDGFEKSGRSGGTENPTVGVSDAPFVFVDLPSSGDGSCDNGSSKLPLKSLDSRSMAVRYLDSQNVSEGSASTSLCDDDGSVCIEKSSDVGEFHGFLLLERDGMVAKSGEHQNGQSRANDDLASVCNESVPPAKAKMDSGLHGNMQRTAETTVSPRDMDTITYNTMSSGGNSTGTEIVLQGVSTLSTLKSRSTTHDVNSGVDGMTAKSGETENRQSRAKQSLYQATGVCNEQMPSSKEKGCSELRRNTQSEAEMTSPLAKRVTNLRYLHFYVDPLMMFRWSESRTWPNQLVDIRILSLRLVLVWKSRMFQTVLDGWSA